MKINLEEKYENNITKKYGHESFEKDGSLSRKEKAMWTIVFWILKDNYPNAVFDTEQDREYLEGCLKIFLRGEEGVDFSYEDWMNYLLSR